MPRNLAEATTIVLVGITVLLVAVICSLSPTSKV
jgi:hypothetical protein